MAVKIVGVQENKGKGIDDKTGREFQWDNVNLHCIGDTDETVLGQKAFVVKAATDTLTKVLKDVGMKSKDDLLGIEIIQIIYNERGRFVGFLM